MSQLPGCPYCGSQPLIDQCADWPRKLGPAPWYAVCYRPGENEHFVGVNGDDRDEAVWNWLAIVDLYKAHRQRAFSKEEFIERLLAAGYTREEAEREWERINQQAPPPEPLEE